MQVQDYDHLFKLCLLGDSGVGKSCIVQRFADDVYTERFVSTVGVDFRTRTIEEGGKVVKLHIWDTAGQERFRSLTANAFRGTHGILFVYDITDMDSFLNVQRVWVEEFVSKIPGHEEVVKLLVGNKSDLSEKRRAVSYQEAQEYAQAAGMPFLETSAKDDVHIGSAFHAMVATICEAKRRCIPCSDSGNSIKLPALRDPAKKKAPCRCG